MVPCASAHYHLYMTITLKPPTEPVSKAWRRPATFAFAAAALVASLHESPWRESIEQATSRVAEFQLRQSLNLAPPQHPKLKIFAFDDTAFQALRTDQPSIADYGRMFKFVSDAGARAIVVDKIFGLPPKDDDELAQLRLDAKSFAPIIVGSFFAPTLIAGRPQLAKSSAGVTVEAGALPEPPVKRLFYGPDQAYADIFARVGHIVHEGSGVFQAAVPFPAGGAIVPSALLIGDKVDVKKSGLFVDGVEVPLDYRGKLRANLLDFRKLSHFDSMRAIWAKPGVGQPSKAIQQGDVVLFLPLLYTGNTDYKDTPVGRWPGGFLIASLVNSALSGNWIRYADAGVLGIVIAAGLAAAAGHAFGALLFLAALLVGLGVIALTGLVFFTHLGIATDWVFLAFAFATSGILTFADKSRRHEKVAARAREALSGLVPPGRLDQIIADPSSMRFEPVEKVLTLMFVDIVGFSSVAETKTAPEVFANLKRTLGRIITCVHAYDGFVDRTLGDGLLCYFGHSPGGSPFVGNHADRAIACAMMIQRESIGITMARLNDEDPIFPLRIGVNTASVFLGDLGDGTRLDYTVIGHGVNIAQRLEAACEPFRIMISDATRQLATDEGLVEARVEKRLIQIKHHSTAMESYELIPANESLLPVDKAQVIYFKFRGIDRNDQRWQVPDAVKITIRTEFGDGELVNYSRHGFSIAMPVYLGRGLETKFELAHERSSQHLTSSTIHGEIRWGRPKGEGRYLHGVLIKHLPDLELDIFLHQLHALCRTKKATG